VEVPESGLTWNKGSLKLHKHGGRRAWLPWQPPSITVLEPPAFKRDWAWPTDTNTRVTSPSTALTACLCLPSPWAEFQDLWPPSVQNNSCLWVPGSTWVTFLNWWHQTCHLGLHRMFPEGRKKNSWPWKAHFSRKSFVKFINLRECWKTGIIIICMPFDDRCACVYKRVHIKAHTRACVMCLWISFSASFKISCTHSP
jgi:hypothetical protein